MLLENEREISQKVEKGVVASDMRREERLLEAASVKSAPALAFRANLFLDQILVLNPLLFSPLSRPSTFNLG